MEYLEVTDDILLYQLKISDAPVIFDAIDKNRDYLRKWLPFVDQTRKVSDTEEFVNSVTSVPHPTRNDVYTIWYKGRFAGLIGYKDTDWVNCKTELGYWMVENCQGKGIMTKTVEKIIDVLFSNFDINRVQIKVAVGNVRSSAIAKRLGFRFEGIERDGEKHQDKYFDLEVFSYLKKEWANS